MRSLSKQLRFRATILFSMLTAAISSEPRLEQSNLLFIMFDDLRPELSIYGRDHMITPNFERLAARSVIFDNVHAQISVCNPSRDSMLTGLRPDTIGTYSFQSSFRPHLTLPSRLASVGYNTAAYGKIAHWETSEKTVWSHDHWNGAWYEYQQFEWNIMNSSTMPDRIKPEEEFRDYLFASKTIETLRVLNAKQEYFMLGVGFKLPHLAVHIPYKYYDMYKGRESGWKLTQEELRFPETAPAISYRCCASADFQFMEEEGSRRSQHKVPIGNINDAFTHKMHEELMIGYAAGVTFVDKQLGRVLDAIDELELWGNLTVVLTADHGMHNGEKGIWEKWSMFDESTRVPLLISHPRSPFKGQHNTGQVELIDIFPTINDILVAPKFDKAKYCKPPNPPGHKTGPSIDLPYVVCNPLQGKSLARAVLGSVWDQSAMPGKMNSRTKKSRKNGFFNFLTGRERGLLLSNSSSPMKKNEYGVWKGRSGKTLIDRGEFLDGPLTTNSVMYNRNFSITQSWRCSPKIIALNNRNDPAKLNATRTVSFRAASRRSAWVDCDKSKFSPFTMSIMGYSIRTREFRYTAWFHYDWNKALPILDKPLFEEELYDHRNEKLSDFTHLEIHNLVYKNEFQPTVLLLRNQLIQFIAEEVVFRGPFS